MIKLLIFDLDGTLADTGQDITNALNYALEPFGVREYSVDETKAMVGSGISILLASLIPDDSKAAVAISNSKGQKPEDLVLNRFLEYYDNHLIENTVAYPYIKETLSKLSDYKKAVLSNKREVYSKRVLQGLDILQYFDLVWGSDSVREKKPSPVPVFDMMEQFSASRDETVLIGDSNYDIEAGKAAGITVIGVTYGFRSREFLKDADHMIDRFDELLHVLSDLNQMG
ncbi:MAG: HAD-IA family hydrolase [Nitrospiraceae bacterium]|nr:MAG: HAD-IA family hydrolase [Nitrospiraceae bacterium]